MRVLLTADTVGGVWSYALQLARGLAAAGVHIDLATMGAPLSRAQRQAVHVSSNITLHESSYKLEWMHEPWHDVTRTGEWLLRLARNTRPDVIHLNSYAHGALPWEAPVLVVGHSCVLTWWRAVHGSPAPAEWDRYRMAVQLGLESAACVVTPTEAFLHELRAHYRFTTAARVIPNGVEPETTSPASHKASERLAAHGRDPVILAAGRVWDEAKNMVTLAAAARQIAYPVYVAGSALHPNGAWRTPHGLRSLGVLEPAALQRWYGRAALFVHPALYEPFGLAPLEAALARCALVLGDIPTLREVWGHAAVYVPPRDPNALATAVNVLVADPIARSARARAAYRRARAFTARRTARAYHQTYCALLSGSAMPDTEVLACAS